MKPASSLSVLAFIVVFGGSERQVDEMFVEASKSYASNPVAFHLRAIDGSNYGI